MHQLNFEPLHTWFGFSLFTQVTVTVDHMFLLFVGRFELNDILLRCTKCPFSMLGTNPENMVQSGYWPSTPTKRNIFYSVELFQLWENVNLNSPGTSLSSFLNSITKLSSAAGRVWFWYSLKGFPDLILIRNLNRFAFSQTLCAVLSIVINVMIQTSALKWIKQNKWVIQFMTLKCMIVYVGGIFWDSRFVFFYRQVPSTIPLFLSLFGSGDTAKVGWFQWMVKIDLHALFALKIAIQCTSMVTGKHIDSRKLHGKSYDDLFTRHDYGYTWLS